MPLDQEAALARLGRMLASDQEPTLTETDLEDLLTDAQTATEWAPSTAYAVGDRVVSTSRNRRLYECREPGTSAATEPDWGSTASQYPGRTFLDGTELEWVDVGPAPKELWNLRAAAAAGWRQKAGLVAGGYEFSTGGQSFKRDQVHKHCLRMAAHYTPLVIA